MQHADLHPLVFKLSARCNPTASAKTDCNLHALQLIPYDVTTGARTAIYLPHEACQLKVALILKEYVEISDRLKHPISLTPIDRNTLIIKPCNQNFSWL